MVLKKIDMLFSICKLESLSGIDFSQEFLFLGKTDEEISLVCPQSSVPGSAVKQDDGWCAFRIEGELDFALTGILSKIASVLANEKIGIFAVSTYNTDYILTKAHNIDRALQVLSNAGYKIV